MSLRLTKPKNGWCLLLLLFWACTSQPRTSSPPEQETQALSMPPGWYLSINNSDIDLVQAEEDKKAYSIHFNRELFPKQVAYFIRLAESIYPDRDKVLTAAGDEGASWFFERIWWFKTYKDNRIPYALTADAIAYYINRYKSFKAEIKKEIAQASGRGSNQRRVEFSYSASIVDEGSVIRQGRTLPRYRVVMQMKWYEYCGQSCGWGFTKNREIVFEGKYTIKSIYGDGPTGLWISTEETPYGPDQWIRF